MEGTKISINIINQDYETIKIIQEYMEALENKLMEKNKLITVDINISRSVKQMEDKELTEKQKEGLEKMKTLIKNINQERGKKKIKKYVDNLKEKVNKEYAEYRYFEKRLNEKVLYLDNRLEQLKNEYSFNNMQCESKKILKKYFNKEKRRYQDSLKKFEIFRYDIPLPYKKLKNKLDDEKRRINNEFKNLIEDFEENMELLEGGEEDDY